MSVKSYLIGDDDCKLVRSLYKQMLAKLAGTVPNTDPANRSIGDFPNGTHAAAGLIDNSDAAAAYMWPCYKRTLAALGRADRTDTRWRT